MTLYLTSNITGCASELSNHLGDVTGHKMLAIITAAKAEENYEDWLGPCQIDPLHQMGFDIQQIDLNEVTATQWGMALKQVNHLFVSGGNTFCLLQAMRHCNFKQSLHSFLDRNGHYIGSSAGGIVCAPDIAYIAPMDDTTCCPIDDTTGLNLIPFYPIPHANHPEWTNIAASIHANTPNSRLIDEEDLIII